MDQNTRFTLEEIFEPLGPHLTLLNDFLDSQVQLFEPELQDLVGYSLKQKGKGLRSMLVFYSAWKGDMEISENLIKVAGVIELAHSASLVHDDILDEATIRRSTPTVFKHYGPKIAVLLGDALFAHALVLASEFKSLDVCFIIAESIKRVCAGEIKQTFHSSKDAYSLEDYYRVIDLKTAELFYTSCLLGARLGGFSKDYVDAVASFGRNIGIAYQIYDDLVDVLGNESAIGKTLGTDFSSGKHTLPTFKLMEKFSNQDRIEFLQNLKGCKITFDYLKSLFVEYDVFPEVFAVVKERIESAGLSIANHKNLPSFPYLRKIQDFLATQVRALENVSFTSNLGL